MQRSECCPNLRQRATAIDCRKTMLYSEIMAESVDPHIRALAEEVIARGKNKRVIAALKVLLDKGSVSTDELQDMGYNHPPRAIGDIRDTGIPIITGHGTSKRTGNRMAVYSFGRPEDIKAGRIGGRSAFPKSFKNELIEFYGSQDCITGALLDEKVLQIDHRIPYRIAGDLNFSKLNVEDFMLLDGSSQRSKSWSCENCPNSLRTHSIETCKTCFWAFPENYSHIATKDYRRTDIAWQDEDVPVHDKIKMRADELGITVAELLRQLARQTASRL